jgi:hypothetical protein
MAFEAMEINAELQSAYNTPVHSVVWQISIQKYPAAADFTDWKDMGTSAALETSYQNAAATHTIVSSGTIDPHTGAEHGDWVITFATMMQVNSATGTTRLVRRALVTDQPEVV